MSRVLLIVVLSIAPVAMPTVAMAKAGQQQPPPDFVPVENAPQGEQIPAMPLMGIAYGFIWVGVFGYVWSVARRLQKVEAELSALESRKS